jgi:hypothetical protein
LASGGTEPLVGTTSHEHQPDTPRRAGLGTARRIPGMAIDIVGAPPLNTTGPWSWQPAGRPVQAGPRVVRLNAWSSIAAPVGRGDDVPQTAAAAPACRDWSPSRPLPDGSASRRAALAFAGSSCSVAVEAEALHFANGFHDVVSHRRTARWWAWHRVDADSGRRRVGLSQAGIGPEAV